MTGKKIKVAVVDDSALMRQMLSAMLSADPDIEVVGTAPDPHVARQLIRTHNPDVITLDIEMPKMDGLSFLEKIMMLRPMPVVMVSSLTQEGAEATLHALELGAVDFVGKPTSDLQHGLKAKGSEIVAKVKDAAKARIRPIRKDRNQSSNRAIVPNGYSSTEKIVAIGASTGGVEALRDVICALPADSPAILVTQHMPAKFTLAFANRLNTNAQVAVCEASDGQRVLPGHVYIAPGDYHLKLGRSGANYICRLDDGPLVSGHRPSVDVLFRSAAKFAGANAVGVILTGMGKDGAQGLLEMRQAGASTLGQNEATCVVYGMPKVAFELNAVEKQWPLSNIPEQMLRQCSSGAVRSIRV